MITRRIVGGALLCLLGVSACGGDDQVGFGPGSTGGTGGAATGGASAGGSGGSGGSSGTVTGGSGGTGGTVSGGTGGTVSGGTGGTVTGGTGGTATGGTGGTVSGGTGGTATGGTGGTVSGGTGGTVTGGTGGTVSGGTGGTGGCTGAADCNDNDACTTDACPSGTCTHTKVDVNDNNACTIDLCGPTTGVSHVGELALFEEDFSDNAAGWTLGTEWEIKAAVASTNAAYGGNDPAADHSASADNGVAGVVVGGFPAKTLHGFYYLESPVIDTTKATPGGFVELRFWRWLNADYTPYMRSRIEVWDGVQWVVIWNTLNQSPANFLIDAPPRGIGWYPMSFDVSAYKNPQFRVRFGFDIGNTGVVTVGAWTVDDFAVVSSPVATDANQCTTMACNGASGAQFAQLPTNDSNPCTIDSCSTSGGLSHVPKTRAYFEDFADNNAGWTLGTQWQIAPAQGSNCGSSSCGGNDPAVDHTGTNDNGVAGGVVGGCTGTAQHGDYCMTSPNINLNGEPGAVTLGYFRHLHSDQTPYMISHVDTSNNGGGAWTQIWASGNACINDPQWTLQTLDVTSYKSATFRLRFCYSIPQAGAFDGGGFSVDDVSLYDPACVTP